MKRVVITGIGVVTPLGNERERFRDRLLAGDSPVAVISHFDPAQLPTRIAAQATIAPTDRAVRDRKVSFAQSAARDAMAHAQAAGRSLHEQYGAGSGGVCLGLGLELFSMPDLIDRLAGRAPAPGVHPLTVLQTPSDLCLHLISHEHDLRQPPLTHISACAASTDAIGAAMRLIRSGRRSWILAGGTDSMINPLGVAGFCKIQAMSRRNHEPMKASRPFDVARDGFVLGEGAAVLVLEALDAAQARGATILAEIGGYGNSLDAHGISEPHPQGDGALAAMRGALTDAGITPEQVVHINAHGTGTPKNDVVETIAIRRLCGAHTQQVSVSATKSMIGHLISASGAVEVAGLVLCANAGWVHPTINLDEQDPACNLDVVRGAPRRIAGGWFLKNSFGFGGQNAALALRIGA